MKIEIDIEKIVADSLAAALDKDRLAQQIQKHVAKVADDAIATTFSTYGLFAKTVKTAVEEIVPHELSFDGAANWTHMIRTVLNERLAAHNDARLQQTVQPMLDAILKPVPKELKLSEFVAAVVEQWEEDFGDERPGDKPTIIVERDHGALASYFRVYMDKAQPKSKHSCGMRIAASSDGSVYSLKFDESSADKERFAGPYYGAEAYAWSLYNGGTKLICDKVDFSDVYYKEVEDNDD